MLTGEDIRAAGLIGNASASGFRASSYDVTIDSIISAGGKVAEEYVLQPQGIVQVISRERVTLPLSISGIATVKTSLCNDGILALSLGIVDPGYSGPVSSFLLNFSNEVKLLKAGDAFLRLQFERLASEAGRAFAVDAARYQDERRRVWVRLSDTFLNLETVIERTTSQTFEKWRNRILAYVGGAALALSLMTFALNFGSLYLVKTWLQPTDAVRADVLRASLADQTAKLVAANEALAARVRAMEAGK